MRPNIIFYFSDQQRSDTFNADVMPHLTRWAQEGVIYEHSYTCQPVCGPARACLQTGVYATQNGSVINGIPLTDELPHLADYFNAAGYDTAYIGKWHLASDSLPGKFSCEKTAVPREKQGGYRYWRASDVLEFTSHGYGGYVFDQDGNRLSFDGYRADAINDFALEYLRNRPQDKPFFLFVSQLEPHHQNDRNAFEAPDGYAARFADTPVPADLAWSKKGDAYRYPDYLGCIRALDDNLERLRACLEELGIAGDTVVVYTSDHGCHFRTRNSEYKRSCHDASLHTPLALIGGAFCGGKRISELVSLIDLPATLLDLAGIGIPSHFAGRSLLGRLEGRGEERTACFAQISESQVGRCIRTQRYTYSVRAKKMGWSRDSRAKIYYDDFLYDNLNDPAQKINLVRRKQYARVKEELRDILTEEMKKAGEEIPKFRSRLAVPKH